MHINGARQDGVENEPVPYRVYINSIREYSEGRGWATHTELGLLWFRLRLHRDTPIDTLMTNRGRVRIPAVPATHESVTPIAKLEVVFPVPMTAFAKATTCHHAVVDGREGGAGHGDSMWSGGG